MSAPLAAGRYHQLKIARIISIGAYLDDGAKGLLLPNRFLPEGSKAGDELEVFVYHDSEDRLIATTQRPHAVVGDFAFLAVVSISTHGAFLDWGLTKDLFVPRSQQREPMKVGSKYLVYLYIDEKSGRVAATEWYDAHINKDGSALQQNQEVHLLVFRKTPLGYAVIADNQYEGLIHEADVAVPLKIGQRLKGFIKQVRDDGKLDIVPGKRGYEKASSETERIMELLEKNGGMLPYNDKSDPQDIYAFFGISKKAFKMAIGGLYKERRIEILPGGIKKV
jgi:hypothetical protein